MAQRFELLIDAGELHKQLSGAHPPIVADCRFSLADANAGETQYRQGHIPGAQYLHLDRDLAAPRGVSGGRHPLPGAAAFQAVMRRIGLDSGAALVAYDDSRGSYAARLWWLARYFGHTQVRILDGGIAAWRNAGYGIGADEPAAGRTGNFVAREQYAMVLDYTAVRRECAPGERLLVDAREPRRFAGEEEPIDPRAGHIPGAINRPWMEAVDANGFFLPAEAQAARWSGLGEASEVVAYCGSGVTACVNLFSLELAGRAGARLYAGSWSDWCSRPDAAIATGS